MPEHGERVVVIDDDELFREEIRNALTGFGYTVCSFSDLASAQDGLGHGVSPILVLADRRIHGERIDERLLSDIRQRSLHSQVVIYTRIDELTSSKVAALHSLGAIRVLDRSEVANSVETLLNEFRDLRELTSALSELTRGRGDLVTALLGADVGVTMIDSQYMCWFANTRQRELIRGPCTGGLCWCLFHDQPPEMGPCWGCGIREVLRGEGSTGAIHRVILTHLGQSARWLSVQTKPIRASDGRIIAGTEAVTPLDDSFVRNMDPRERCFDVARGLVHAGLGRVRVYERQADTETMKVVAAASRTDPYEARDYYDTLSDLSLEYTQCPYARRAVDGKVGTLVDSWDSGRSPFAIALDLAPPYFLVPICDDSDGHLVGLLAADFGGWEDSRKPTAVEHLAKQESLRWIREGYGTQIRGALAGIRSGVTVLSQQSLARQEAALRSRQRIGAASSLEDAVTALREGFAEIAPDCFFSVRRKKGNHLVAEERLDIPSGLTRPDVVADSDPDSLAAYVLTTYLRPLWIDDYQEYREGRAAFLGPKGLSADDIRSVAQIPLRFETTIYGVLSVDSPNLHRWRQEGFVGPLMDLAEHAALVLRDITIRDELEEARLKIQEADRLRIEAAHRQQVLELQMIANVADHLPLCVFVKNKDHVFLYVNKRFQEDVGKTRTDIVGKTDLELFGKEYAAVYQAADDEVLRTGNTFEDRDEQHPSANGEEREVRVIKTPFRTPSGNIDGVVGVYWDVTETNRWFRQVQSWRDGFVQSANAIVYAHDMRGVITFANPAAARLLGYGTEELEGKSVYDLVSPEHRDKVRLAIHMGPGVGENGAKANVQEFDVCAKDGRVLNLEVATSSCEVGSGERGILGVGHDVTERNRARARLAHELERVKALRSVTSSLGLAGEVPTLHRLFMLAVTRGECLGFSRAILFLPTGQGDRFVASLAVGPADWKTAQERWEEAKDVSFDTAVAMCLRPAPPARPGDLQLALGNLTLDLDTEAEVASALRQGRSLLRRRGKPCPIQNPQFAAAIRTDMNEDVEYVLAPLKQGGELAAILWADRAFLADPIVQEATVHHFDILWAETALMVDAIHNRAREQETRTAHDVARGMSYSLFTRAAVLEFELARLRWALGGKHADAITAMRDAIEFFKHAGALATKTLELIEIGARNSDTVNLNALVEDIVGRRQDGRIFMTLCSSPLNIQMNNTHAEDMVVEILVNALDFTDKASGRIDVATSTDGHFARFEVSDNGPGIHQAVRPNLFRRFTRHPEGRLGMGLSYVKGLVEAYGGNIEETGTVGKGAHFMVRLPLTGGREQ